MVSEPAWWRNAAFAVEVARAQDNLTVFERNMERQIAQMRRDGVIGEGLLVGYLCQQAVEGTEGEVWTLCSDTFDFMPMPINPEQRIQIFRSDWTWGPVQRLQDLSATEFFNASVYRPVGLCLPPLHTTKVIK